MTEGVPAEGTVDDVVRRFQLAEGAVARRKTSRTFRAFLLFFVLRLARHFRPLSHQQSEEKVAEKGDQVDQLQFVAVSLHLRGGGGGRGRRR